MTDRKPNGYWLNINNALAEARKAMENEEWETLPDNRTLIKNGYSKLAQSIRESHRGYYKFRKLLRDKPKILARGTWKNLDSALAQTERIMRVERWEELPGGQELNRAGYSALVKAATQLGGMDYFRQMLKERMTDITEKQRLGSLLEQYVVGGNGNE